MAAPSSETRSSSSFAVLALGLALIGAASMLYYHLGYFVPRALKVADSRDLGKGYSFGDDFYQIWLTSRESLHHRRDPYSPEMTREIQIGLYGRPLDPHRPRDPLDRRAFPYPAFVDLLFWPTANVPFPLVRVLVVCVLVPLTVATVLLWLNALSWRLRWPWVIIILLLVLCSYPVLEGFYAGQVGLLVGFLLGASIFVLRRGRLFLSGILLALTTIKPQVTLLAILYLLLWSSHDWRKRGRLYVGFFSTLFLLVSSSLLVWRHWIQSWVHNAVEYHGYTMPPLVSAVLAVALGPRIAGPFSFALNLSLLVAATVLAWRNRSAPAESAEFWLTLSLLLAITTVILLPGQAVYDHGILLPGILLIASWRRELSQGSVLKALLAMGMAVLLWPWIASFALIAFHPLLPQPRIYSNAAFALPLRTAAVFPFVVLGLLALALRTRSQQQHLLFASPPH
jgi:Glycosyltransferase family 87